MAYSGKLTSIRQVVESAYYDSGIDNIDYPFAIETCVQLMGIIGVPDLYIEKTTNGEYLPFLEVKDFRVKLPDDMVNMIDMRSISLNDDGSISSYSEMIESSDIYHHSQNYNQANSISVLDSETNRADMELDDDDELQVSSGIVVGGYGNVGQLGFPITYKIQGNYIFTNFENGYIEAVYTGYALDEEGFPMIPDDEKFKAALKYEIIYKIDWKKWRTNPASPGLKAVVNDSEQRRDWYVGAARNKGRIPTIGQMESIKNQWLRTIPKIHSHGNGFKTNNIGEQRYNQSNRSARR